MPKGVGIFGMKSNKNKYKLDAALSSSDWSSRKSAYTAAAATFRKPDHDPRRKKWALFANLVKTLTAERNIPALEKGLEAVLAFVENCSIVDDDVVKSVLTNVVQITLSGVKPRIRGLANRICMALFERKRHEMVTETLMMGMDSKVPKVAFASIRSLTNVLVEFGPTNIDVPMVARKAVAMCQEKTMFQQDMKDLLREIYKCVGAEEMERYVEYLDASQRKAMEIEFLKVDRDLSKNTTDAPMPWLSTRPKSVRPPPTKIPKPYRPATSSKVTAKSRQNQSPPSKAKPERACGDLPMRKIHRSVTVKMELEEIFMMMENKQWSDRKEAVDELHSRIISSTTFCAADYSKIVKRLRVIILEDTNVVLVSKAIKCVTALGKSRNEEFQQHAPLMMTLLLEKFKDKKSVIIEATREAIDVIYLNYQFETMARYVALSLLSSNPSVKAETAFFVQRCFARPTTALLRKNIWKPLVQGLTGNLTFPDQVVRERAMKALGAVMKTIGGNALSPYLTKVARHQVASIVKYCNDMDGMDSSRSLLVMKETSVESTDFSSADHEHSRAKTTKLLPGFCGQETRQCQAVYESSDESYKSPTWFSTYRRNDDNQKTLSNTSIFSLPRSKNPLSLAAKEKLASFRCEINQLKNASKDIHPQSKQQDSVPSTNGLESAKQMARKLQDLEGTIKEIRQLSPQLYEELKNSGTQSTDVIHTLNTRLHELERLLRSMALQN